MSSVVVCDDLDAIRLADRETPIERHLLLFRAVIHRLSADLLLMLLKESEPSPFKQKLLAEQLADWFILMGTTSLSREDVITAILFEAKQTAVAHANTFHSKVEKRNSKRAATIAANGSTFGPKGPTKQN